MRQFGTRSDGLDLRRNFERRWTGPSLRRPRTRSALHLDTVRSALCEYGVSRIPSSSLLRPSALLCYRYSMCAGIQPCGGHAPNNAFEPSGWPRFRRAAGALREFAPATRSDRPCAAAQRGR
jgi:hypothetical protein